MTRNFPLPNLNLQNSNLPKFSIRNWKTGKKGDSNDRLSPSLDSRLQGKLGKGRKRLSWLGEGSSTLPYFVILPQFNSLTRISLFAADLADLDQLTPWQALWS
ncbi:peptide/nitrate transporter-like protein [Corchorus olitorius]|uniref:Peptide/nitrate transporter-like protein n=1 Tax=Corchorus olitorius TaxID=93759 RepID=A0A1R3KIU3_9ROSI|nr:peptide/nitrate transporter-like protein [Corchorus olitorius]